MATLAGEHRTYTCMKGRKRTLGCTVPVIPSLLRVYEFLSLALSAPGTANNIEREVVMS